MHIFLHTGARDVKSGGRSINSYMTRAGLSTVSSES